MAPFTNARPRTLNKWELWRSTIPKVSLFYLRPWGRQEGGFDPQNTFANYQRGSKIYRFSAGKQVFVDLHGAVPLGSGQADCREKRQVPDLHGSGDITDLWSDIGGLDQAARTGLCSHGHQARYFTFYLREYPHQAIPAARTSRGPVSPSGRAWFKAVDFPTLKYPIRPFKDHRVISSGGFQYLN